jgi:hypothetical protein
MVYIDIAFVDNVYSAAIPGDMRPPTCGVEVVISGTM